MRLIAIRFGVSMILVKMWMEHFSNVFVGSSSVGGLSGVLVDLIFFRICFVCNFPWPWKELGT